MILGDLCGHWKLQFLFTPFPVLSHLLCHSVYIKIENIETAKYKLIINCIFCISTTGALGWWWWEGGGGVGGGVQGETLYINVSGDIQLCGIHFGRATFRARLYLGAAQVTCRYNFGGANLGYIISGWYLGTTLGFSFRCRTQVW